MTTKYTFKRNAFISFVVFWLTVVSIELHASQARAPSNGGGNNALFQRMLQQTTAERDELALKVTELEEKLAKVEKEKKRVEKKLNAKNQSLDKFKDSNKNMSDLLLSMKERMQELIDKFRDTAQKLRDAEQQNVILSSDLQQRNAEIARHVENNIKLYGIGMEVLEKYEDKGIWDSFFQQEPITQLKRAEIESIKEEYRVEIEKLKVDEELESNEAQVAQR